MIVVFWLDNGDSGYSPEPVAMFETFKSHELLESLTFAEALRKSGASHVTISSQLSDSVGKSGVGEIVEGELPDGHAYEWSKQHRGAGPQ